MNSFEDLENDTNTIKTLDTAREEDAKNGSPQSIYHLRSQLKKALERHPLDKDFQLLFKYIKDSKSLFMQFTKDEVDAMTKQELKNRLPEYYMFMHWPMM